MQLASYCYRPLPSSLIYPPTYLTPAFSSPSTPPLSPHPSSGNVDATFTAINLASSSISVVNCTAVPPKYCATRYRQPCLEAGTPNTCGSCLAGFRGMVGDGNLPCVNASLPVGALGAPCADPTDCLYHLCTAGKCAAPSMTCPTNVPDSPCSGHGACKLGDLSGNTVFSCTIVDTMCTATCQCQEGYGGSDCSLTPKELAQRSTARTDMCDALTKVIVTQDKSSHLLDVIVTALLSSYEVRTALYTHTGIHTRTVPFSQLTHLRMAFLHTLPYFFMHPHSLCSVTIILPHFLPTHPSTPRSPPLPGR
jgi:hypothetical protein